MYNFTGQPQISEKKDWRQFLSDIASLQISNNAFLDALKTILVNRRHGSSIKAHTHFSLNMGHSMMLAFLGQSSKEVPANFMRELNAQSVESIIAERRPGAMRWAAAHTYFVEVFEEAKTISDTVTGTLNVAEKKLLVNGHTYPIVLGVGEVITTNNGVHTLSVSGWTVDEINKRHVRQIIATVGTAVVAQGFPTVKLPDIDLAIGRKDVPSGFCIDIPLFGS